MTTIIQKVLYYQLKTYKTTISLSIVTALFFILFSNPVLYAHTFSENENALFLTMINNIKAETHLVARDFSNNTQQAHQHAKAAAALLTQNDPVANTTWTSEISEKNPRVVTDLLHSLNNLKTTVASSPSNSNSNSNSIQSKVTNIDNLLDEAVSVRISKDIIDNPKTQALVLANLGNEIYTKYGKALGLSPSTIASMGGMKASTDKGSSGTTNAAINRISTPIKNVTAYETAQSLVTIAQQIFNKDLKPMAPANTTSSTTSIGKYIDQLKNALDNKESFMNIMKLVHVKLHPTMIAGYNLTLGH